MDAIKDLLKNRYVLMGLYLLGCFVVCKIIGLIFRAAGKKGRVGIKASFTKAQFAGDGMVFKRGKKNFKKVVLK